MLLEMAADGMGDRVAVGPSKDGLTYAGLLDQARRVAAVVADSGAERVVFVAPELGPAAGAAVRQWPGRRAVRAGELPAG